MLRVRWSRTQHSPEGAKFHEHGLGQAGKFQESPAYFAFEFEPDQEQVSDQGGPDLNEHGIPASAVEGLDFRILLDPLEKEFDLPAAAIKLGYLPGG